MTSDHSLIVDMLSICTYSIKKRSVFSYLLLLSNKLKLLKIDINKDGL